MDDPFPAGELAVAAEIPVLPLEAVPIPAEDVLPAPAEEQLSYARLLDGGMKVGLAALAVTFTVYVAGLVTPHVPVADLPRYWSLPVTKYLAATGVHPGWAWLQMVHRADFLNFVGIAFLSGVTLVCYLSIIPVFFRKRELVYCSLAVLEVLVLALAASGILEVGAH